METNEILRLATDKNLCKPWQEKMKEDSSLKNLCQMYFDGDDWSMENDFPNVEVLRDFKGKTEAYGLFTDYVGMPNNLLKSAFFGASNIQLIYNHYSVSQLILRHQTKAKIKASENAIVIINILDESELEIECIENARVEVFSYSNANIKYSGDVRIHKSRFEK